MRQIIIFFLLPLQRYMNTFTFLNEFDFHDESSTDKDRASFINYALMQGVHEWLPARHRQYHCIALDPGDPAAEIIFFIFSLCTL